MRNSELAAVGFGPRAILALMFVFAPHSAFLTPHCEAHQVPRSEYDRNVTVSVRDDGLVVVYRVDLDEFTLLQLVANPANGFPLPMTGKLGRKDFFDAFVRRMKEVIPDQFLATVDGKPVPFACTHTKTQSTVERSADSPQFYFTLRGPTPFGPGTRTVEVEDLNFNDKKGRLSIKFDTVEPLTAVSLSEIAERRLTGVDNGKQAATAKVRVPESPPTPKKETPPVVVEPPVVEPGVLPEQPKGFRELFRVVRETENLALLLDTNAGLAAILLLAFLHGVMHSVAPGHGKTMVAAYLVGEQGTPKHAVILGLIVTLTHTSAAFAVALLLKFLWQDTPPETVQRVLGVGGGLLVAFIGLWLLMQRVTGRSDHVHLGSHRHSHSHGADHGHGHSHGMTPEQFRRVSWVRLILLGISGGIIPCWGAILWILYCVTAGRYGLAVWAVLAFSAGLALVLILIGLLVVYGERAGAKKFAGRKWARYVGRWLPVVGAVAVIAIGLWLTKVHLSGGG